MNSNRTKRLMRQHSWDDDYVTVTASVPQPPPGSDQLDIESSGRFAIGALLQQLREAGGDPRRITRSSIGVSKGEYSQALAAVRDEIFASTCAVHSIYLLDEGCDAAFVTELDAARA
jgi:hypothetical protein